MEELGSLTKLLEVFGQSGLLVYGCYFFLKQLKIQYDERMEQYEGRIKHLEEENRELKEKYEAILLKLAERE